MRESEDGKEKSSKSEMDVTTTKDFLKTTPSLNLMPPKTSISFRPSTLTKASEKSPTTLEPPVLLLDLGFVLYNHTNLIKKLDNPDRVSFKRP